MINLTMKMQSMLKIKFLMSAIYHQSVRYVYYDDLLFLFYGLLWAPRCFTTVSVVL